MKIIIKMRNDNIIEESKYMSKYNCLIYPKDSEQSNYQQKYPKYSMSCIK